jgi:thiamine pyrophosphokinase
LKAGLFLGGQYPSSNDYYSRRISKMGVIAAADSGAEKLRELERPPEMLVGDMDSVSPATLDWCRKSGAQILTFPPEKDDTDTTLAIRALYERGVLEVDIFGASGKREDHFLATLFSIYGADAGMKLLITEENFQAGLIKEDDSCTIMEAIEGETWSFLPFGGGLPVVTLEGFKYPLIRQTLDYTRPLGVSNVATGPLVKVLCRGGALLYFRWLKEF